MAYFPEYCAMILPPEEREGKGWRGRVGGGREGREGWGVWWGNSPDQRQVTFPRLTRGAHLSDLVAAGVIAVTSLVGNARISANTHFEISLREGVR